MAPTETNHRSGDVGGQPSQRYQHQPAAQQMEQYPDSISLSQTPETDQLVPGLGDNDHPGADVDSTRADLANDAPGVPAPHVRFMMDSPPHPEAHVTPSPPLATAPGPNPPWKLRITAWRHDQDENGPPIGLGLTLYPPGTPGVAGAAGAAGDPVVPAHEGGPADRPAEEAVGDGSAATCGGQVSSSSSGTE